MRFIIVFCCVLILAVGCDSSKRPVSSDKPDTATSDTVRIVNDSLEYEITIIEPGFYGWLMTQRGKNYYSVDFLEMRNQRYAMEYNRRVYDPSYPRNLYVQEINYDPQVRYGLEVNYLLYHYFLYFEQTYNQDLK